MKRIFLFSRAALFTMATALTLSLTACSDDNDEPEHDGPGTIPELPALEYESSAAKYDITSAESDIASIELTANGQYIIISKYASGNDPVSPFTVKNATKSLRQQVLSPAAFGTASRSGDQGVIEGKYIKMSDTEYILEGWGSIVIEGDPTQGPNAFSLQITDANGNTHEFEASKDNGISSSPLAIAMCRIWNVDMMGIKMALNGSLIYNNDKPASKFSVMLREVDEAMMRWVIANGGDVSDWEPDEYDDVYPTQIVMTRAGTYMVFYSDGTLAISTWRWINEEKGQFSYSWEYDDPGNFTTNYVSFSGTNMNISENHTITETDEDGTYTMSLELRYRMSIPK